MHNGDIFLNQLGLGPTWWPVEFGYSMARTQCWRNFLCLLFIGHHPSAWTSATQEICTRGTGHEQVRQEVRVCYFCFEWIWLTIHQFTYCQSSFFICDICLFSGVQRWCPTKPDHCPALPPRSWGSDASTERGAHPWTVSMDRDFRFANSKIKKKSHPKWNNFFFPPVSIAWWIWTRQAFMREWNTVPLTLAN